MDNSQAVRLAIRKMTANDLDVVLAWRNHPEIRRYMYTQHEISIEEHRTWFERASQDSKKHLLVFEKDEKPQGFVNITELSSFGVVDWGFYIAPDAVKGTGRQLGETVLNYAFNSLKLHKVCGQALAFNERSIKFHYGLGFQQEGTLRDQHYDGENYHAVICFGLLRSEWQLENGNQ
ncbi:UDP-4-amino-4,6-dideoxy-N-acetyl-beta-L-altrosamine N-acetyltransferase [Pseudomonas sp. NFACC13-1]|uniref:UDP-4-amino-4, 6-dideoxy-N-acetyl-beta-L-altrosamine N-acetyltransferase n=1 Tax=Pseudomonas sp. NFACC13-1 TaxID=1566245 RepID=UPI000890E085|nr:UDP-4-amino-4,6-dideoxy-N-acetyl-beta-L-altrosamine N-acetyltransferase [Pseudomonas sp. NFACC13-1]SDB16428.1 UDP-4-amino-4,6-dideoxy-N-acetyl-beta-L-altrosamine N-acetyltransferase [Pseudomonas sp. NFACC13-1]